MNWPQQARQHRSSQTVVSESNLFEIGTLYAGSTSLGEVGQPISSVPIQCTEQSTHEAFGCAHSLDRIATSCSVSLVDTGKFLTD